MKKYIKQFATFALIAALASCSSDDDVDYTSVGGNAVPKASISRLDRNYDLPIALFTKDGVTATKVEIYKNTAKASEPIVLGEKIADATITAEGASFNTSKLPSFDEFPVTANGETTNTGKTGTFSLAIISTYSDGSTTKATYTLTVGKGIVWKVLDADGLPKTTSSTSGVIAVNYLDPTPVYVYYATVKNGATKIDEVVGEYSINGSETFKTLPGDALPTTTGKIDVANIIPWSEIHADDVITFRFTVTAGTQTDVISTDITFADQVFGADTSGTLSNSDTTSQFSFQTGKSYDGADAENAEITFVSGFGFKKARTDVRIEFVKSTLDYDDTNLFEAEAAFNAATKVTALSDLKTNDVVLYKVTRNVNLGSDDEPNWQDVTSYGLMKITDRVAGSTSQELAFSYKEGVLYQVTPTPPVVVATAK